MRGKSRHLVVGSGPAGVACAAALVARGERPVVLDGGRTLDPGRARAVEALSRSEPAAWDESLLAELRGSFPVDVDRLPLKPSFGSTYPYADERLRADGVAAVASLAVGGLSTVWGAAILPFSAREHAGWPFGPETLAPHYRAVFGFLPLAGEEDALAEEFPLYGEPRRLEPTPQMAALLADLRGSAALAGRARLAVRVEACRLTGLCMSGCPYGAIWSARQTLAGLDADHRPGAVVSSFEERGEQVLVRLEDGGELVAERLYLAAGALESTRLVLVSLGLAGTEVSLADSGYYTVPLLRRRGARVSPETAGNTLAQAFVELDDPALSAHRVHLQLYGFNDLMLRAVSARARLPERVAQRLLAPLLGRLLYVQGYLHSDESPRISAQVDRDGVLHLAAPPPDAARPRRVVAALGSLGAGLRPLTPMLQAWPAGKGFHHGGSLPMRERPGRLESDLLGRPAGLRRVHVVDAAVLPTIPAQTITLPAMANAHRIATEATA